MIIKPEAQPPRIVLKMELLRYFRIIKEYYTGGDQLVRNAIFHTVKRYAMSTEHLQSTVKAVKVNWSGIQQAKIYIPLLRCHLFPPPAPGQSG